MVASLTNGEVYQGPIFQVTQETRIYNYGPLWNGWGPGWGWGHGWAAGAGAGDGTAGDHGAPIRDDHPL